MFCLETEVLSMSMIYQQEVVVFYMQSDVMIHDGIDSVAISFLPESDTILMGQEIEIESSQYLSRNRFHHCSITKDYGALRPMIRNTAR